MKLKIEYLEPDRIKPYERNARTHSPEQVRQIASSIQEFGFTNPIIADEQNVVIAGHGRLEASILLGLPSVPVIRVGHLSERQRRALTLADNRIALSSGWDFSALAGELSDLASLDFDIGLTGFDEQEISALLQDDQGILPSSWTTAPPNAPHSAAGQAKTHGDNGNFDDPGIGYKRQYGVIVMCGDEASQASVYERLCAEGFTCKVVVT